MDMNSRNQYLKILQERYFQVVLRKEKSEMLDEYCHNTGQSRKYVIWKINQDFSISTKRKKKKQKYDGFVTAILAKIWEIFDYPCGQRLVPLLKTEIFRLRQLKELVISEEITTKLTEISPATIDRKLRHQKEVLHLSRKKGQPRLKSLLYKKIPMRLNDWDTSIIGNLGIDFVLHCGYSASGEYVNTLSVTDISSGWWEGQGIMGRGQYPTLEALKRIRERCPFDWLEIHPDNDTSFINDQLFRYCEKEKLRFSRSRPNKKNDNCYVEQKNWTHIKKFFGYLRYDTLEELTVMNNLYENELRLFKNFFSPVMKLVKKERVGSKVKRKYDLPKTPYQRLLESKQISEETKQKLKEIYQNLNPVELKKNIELKTQKLYQIYEKKNKKEVIPFKKQSVRSVRNYMIQPLAVGLGA